MSLTVAKKTEKCLFVKDLLAGDLFQVCAEQENPSPNKDQLFMKVNERVGINGVTLGGSNAGEAYAFHELVTVYPCSGTLLFEREDVSSAN